MILALVLDGAIASIISVEEDSAEYANILKKYAAAVEITDWQTQPKIGWLLQADGSFLDPVTQVNWQAPVRITRLAFRSRFTGPEKSAIYTAAESSMAIKSYLDDLAAASFIDLTRADTIANVNALASAGLITSDRAHTILTTPLSALELYKE